MNAKELFDLSGKNAVIFGGAGGLGKLIAKAYAEAGARVAIASRSEEKLSAACKELKEETGFDFRYYVCDATDEEAVAAAAKKANEDMGPVTILVNSQGINKKVPVLDFPVEDFNNVMNANVTSILITAKHFGAYMKEAGYGKIVNVTSVRGKIATRGAGNAAYCASKGAEDMLTKVLAAEFGPYGITVNGFGPNIMKTPMMNKVFEMRAAENNVTVEEYLKIQGASLPLKRMSDPDDCVGTALFLAAPASDFLTGNILYPDGGLTAIG